MTDAEPILVLTTGGTIDKQYFDALSQYQITDSIVSKLLETARVTLPFEIVELTRKDSLELDDSDRERIATTVREPSSVVVMVTSMRAAPEGARAEFPWNGALSAGVTT